MQLYCQSRGSLELFALSAPGVHRSQAPSSGRRKEPKPCIFLKAAGTSLAWAPEASEAPESYSSSSKSLADVAEELLRSEERKMKRNPSSPSDQHLQEQLTLQLERALRPHGGLKEEVQSLALDTTQGRTPWNKGKKMSSAHKQKISNAQKKRWRESPMLRDTIVPKLKGKVPWNKGKKLSLETRLRMSLAKKGRMHSHSTRRKMSIAHTNLGHTPETAAKLSSALTGKPKTQDHREAIAAAARRRSAAASILRAVEDVHSQQQAPSPVSGTGRLMSRSGASSSGRQMQSTVLSSYKAELREFRALQEELEPWTEAFKEQHQRKPTLADVQATRIPWLINQYKQYVLMRERLLNDTQKLRTKLQKAIPEPNNSVRNIRSFQDRMNANSSGSTSGKDAAARIHSALEYKRNSAAAPDGNLFSSTKPSAEALSASAAGLGMQNRDEQGAKQTAGSDQDKLAESDGLSEKLARLSPSAPPRVASAMSAAMQYRKLKAEKVAAAARAAAAAAVAAGSGSARQGSSAGSGLESNGSSPTTTGNSAASLPGQSNGVPSGTPSGPAASLASQRNGITFNTSSKAISAAIFTSKAQPQADVDSTDSECD